MKKIDNNNKKELAGTTEGGTPSLGTIAKSSPLLKVKVKSKVKEVQAIEKARAVFINAGLASGLDIPTKYHRTSLCKHACTGSAGVGVNLLVEANKGFYTGLQTCGSVWTCPVCASKIQEIRRLEIASAMKYFYAMKKASSDDYHHFSTQ